MRKRQNCTKGQVIREPFSHSNAHGTAHDHDDVNINVSISAFILMAGGEINNGAFHDNIVQNLMNKIKLYIKLITSCCCLHN